MIPVQELRIAHSPDPDDAYMFYGLAKGKVALGGARVRHVLKDIQSLNRDARRGLHHVTAVSAAAFPSVSSRYWALSVGASVGRGYGPVVVCRAADLAGLRRREWSGVRVATPGAETTALMVLRLARGGFSAVNTRFERVLDAVSQGRVEAGLVIHEGQLTYGRQGLVRALDLGRWWRARTGLPLPLGLDLVRKDLGRPAARRLARALRDSIGFAEAHHAEALRYALRYGRGVDRATGDRFVRMYVNRDTRDLGVDGEKALRTLYRMAAAKGLMPKPPAWRLIRP